MLSPQEIVVFLGPSLPRAEAEARLPAVYLPPVEQGDVIGVVRDLRPRVIAIIDGVFHAQPSVWHKEILYAMSRGVHVFGASSMGALRAAELSTFGMRGVGRVFELYASGECLDDDEVALSHHGADGGFRPITEPMANVRATLAAALCDGLVDTKEHDDFVEHAKCMYFADRTRVELMKSAAARSILGPGSRVPRCFEERYVDLKRLDALELLARVAELPASLEPFEPGFELSSNRIFQTLLNRDAALYADEVKLTRDDVPAHFALHDPRFDAFAFAAMNRELVQILAARLGIGADEEGITEERRRFKLKHGLIEDGHLDAWLLENHLLPEEFDDLMRQRAVCRRMHRWLWRKSGSVGSVAMITAELQLNNAYVEALHRASLQQRLVEHHAPFVAEEERESDMSVADLVRQHVIETGVVFDQHYGHWIREANFPTTGSLAYALIRAKAAREAMLGMFADADTANDE